jgi:hypothetical protein
MIGFGKLKRKEEATTIMTLTDNRLVKIDPQEDGFFDVLNCGSTNENIKLFIEAVAEVKDAKLEPFYKPIYDPSEEDKKVVYKKGKKPALGKSYN